MRTNDIHNKGRPQNFDENLLKAAHIDGTETSFTGSDETIIQGVI